MSCAALCSRQRVYQRRVHNRTLSLYDHKGLPLKFGSFLLELLWLKHEEMHSCKHC